MGFVNVNVRSNCPVRGHFSLLCPAELMERIYRVGRNRQICLAGLFRSRLGSGLGVEASETQEYQAYGNVRKGFFNVAHDSAHPFTISVSRGLPVTVLGTRFQVDQSDSLTRVDVLDGKVSFGRMTLTKGMSASYRPETGLQEMTSGDVLNPMAWATGSFVYEESSLDDVIKDLESFYHVRINVSESVDGKRLTGTFPTADMASVLEIIGMACDVRLTI